MASMKEARELSKTVHLIPVKDKAKEWEPDPSETYSIIKQGVLEALHHIDEIEEVKFDPPYKFSMTLTDGFTFEDTDEISWKGSFIKSTAYWEAPNIEIGLELFGYVRERIIKCV